MVTEDRPGDNDLGGGDGLALSSAETVGDSLDFGGIDKQRNVPAVVAESGVSGDDDVLLGAVLDQGDVGKSRVTFDLIDGGDDASGGDDALELEGECCQ